MSDIEIKNGVYVSKENNDFVWVFEHVTKPNYGGIVKFLRKSDDCSDWLFEHDFLNEFERCENE